MREIKLGDMTSQQLEDLLKAELGKDCIDRDKVLEIMRILESRESSDSVTAPVDAQAIWEEYQTNRDREPAQKKPRGWISIAAAAAIFVVLFVSAKPAIGAENIFEFLGRWTESVFALFNPHNEVTQPQEYVFASDHPGLQQVYDAVAQAGITDPVVPMWVPDGYELVFVQAMPIPTGTKIHAQMNSGSKVLTISISNVTELFANQYSKDEAGVTTHESFGVKHYIMQNEDKCVAVWITNNVECSVSAHCSVDTLLCIVDSIYEEIIE